MIGRLQRSAVDLIFPPRCLVCGEPGEGGEAGLCRLCRQSVDGGRASAACPRCGTNVAPFGVARGSCNQCRRHRPGVDGTVRVGPYIEVLAHIVKTYKYYGCEEYEPILGRWLAETVESASWCDQLEAVVSVPAYWTRRLTRSFHAAERIGAVVATHLGLSHVPLLRRVRGGPSQIGLNQTQRLQNVKGAFRMRRGFNMVNARLLLVDDVRTTGATLAECARVLRRAGAKKVYAGAVVSADTPGAGMIASSSV